VTHYDVSSEDIETALRVIRVILGNQKPANASS